MLHLYPGTRDLPSLSVFRTTECQKAEDAEALSAEMHMKLHVHAHSVRSLDLLSAKKSRDAFECGTSPCTTARVRMRPASHT